MNSLKMTTIGIIMFLSFAVSAQFSIHVNIGSPPAWGPEGYPEARYYYLPDIETYYDINSSMFIYYQSGIWVRRAYLPSRYRDYDLHRGYKVVMRDYRGETPYDNFNDYRRRYARGYRGEYQRSIGERHERGNYRDRRFDNDHSNRRGNNDRNFGHGNNRDMNNNDQKHDGGGKGRNR